MYVGLHVKYLLFLPDFNYNPPNIQFHKIPSSRWGVPCKQMEDRQTDRQTWWNQGWLFTILQTHLKSRVISSYWIWYVLHLWIGPTLVKTKGGKNTRSSFRKRIHSKIIHLEFKMCILISECYTHKLSQDNG